MPRLIVSCLCPPASCLQPQEKSLNIQAIGFVAQGLTECRQVAGQISAAIAYKLLSSRSQDQADAAICLAKLDWPLLQVSTNQAGVTKVTSLSMRARRASCCTARLIHVVASRQNQDNLLLTFTTVSYDGAPSLSTPFQALSGSGEWLAWNRCD